MRASRRSAAARLSFAMAVTAAISFAAAGAVQAATNPVTIAVKVGYSGFSKAQAWNPVTIDVTNKGSDVDGTLEVTSPVSTNGPPIGAVVYQAHLNVPSGSTKHIRTYLIEDQAPAPVSVRIVQNGRTVASTDSTGSSAATTLIGVLSDQPTALDSFSSVHPGSLAATVVHLSPEEVGDSAILLRAFDLLAIDDYATDTLTSAQRGALTDYVQNGGNLLLGTGASWRKTLGGVSPSILPMQPAGTSTLGSTSAFDGLAGVEIATGTVNAGTHVWLSADGSPLLAERPAGSGLVTIATFDFNQNPVAGWTGADALLRQVLVRTVFNGAPGQGGGFAKGPFGPGGFGSSSITERSSSVSQALSSLPALDLPSLLVIGILVLVYVLLVGPVNYFALRALNHRALAWVTVPLIAIVASAGAFGAGLFTKGRSVQTNQVSIVHLQPGWDRAYEESYTGVLTPTRGDYQVAVGGGRPMVAPLFSSNGFAPGVSPDLITVGTDGGTITLPGMTAFVLRGFATEGVVASPQVVAVADFVNGKLTGTIRNDSGVSFTDALVLAGDAYQLIPALKPGATASFSFAPKALNSSGGPPAVATIYTNYINGPPPNQPTDAEREGLEKSAILGLVEPTNFNGINPTIAPIFVGWTKQPYEQVTVAGSQARPTSESAVVLPVTVNAFGAGTVPSGMIVSRFTDMEGDSQPGPPSGVATMNGTVSYTFTPSIASGLHLTNAALDTSSQIQMGGGPGTTQIQVKAWSWSTSTWVSVSYTSFGTSALPDSVINPATGEVRLQMTAQGTLTFLGQISLTGTVK